MLTGAASSTQSDYQNALSIIKNSRLDYSPKVFKCSSLMSIGVDEIWNEIKKFCQIRKKSGNFFLNRELRSVLIHAVSYLDTYIIGDTHRDITY